MIGDFEQPTRMWLADVIDNLNELMQAGEDPTFWMNLMGAEIEIRLTKLPDFRRAGDRDTSAVKQKMRAHI